MWVLHMKPTFMLEEDVVTSAIWNTANQQLMKPTNYLILLDETNQLSQLEE